MSALARALELAPIIERVHGSGHSELTRVRELTEQISGSTEPEATSALFQQLREVTNNYALPEDACEAFQETYASLEAAEAELTQ